MYFLVLLENKYVYNEQLEVTKFSRQASSGRNQDTIFVITMCACNVFA